MYQHSRAALGEYDGLFDVLAAPFKAAYSVGKTAVQTAAKVAPYVAPLIPGGPLVTGAIMAGSQLVGGTPESEQAALQLAEASARSPAISRRRAVQSLAPQASAVEVGTMPQRSQLVGPPGGFTIPPAVLYGGAGLLVALLLLRPRR